MKVNYGNIWEFDVDDTLVIWDLSKYAGTDLQRITVPSMRHPGMEIELIVNQKNVNLLIKLSKIGYYIRVHSGSGAHWAAAIVLALNLADYVDIAEAKPRGKTDDKPPGDGITYLAYRDPISGGEAA